MWTRATIVIAMPVSHREASRLRVVCVCDARHAYRSQCPSGNASVLVSLQHHNYNAHAEVTAGTMFRCRKHQTSTCQCVPSGDAEIRRSSGKQRGRAQANTTQGTQQERTHVFVQEDVDLKFSIQKVTVAASIQNLIGMPPAENEDQAGRRGMARIVTTTFVTRPVSSLIAVVRDDDNNYGHS